MLKTLASALCAALFLMMPMSAHADDVNSPDNAFLLQDDSDQAINFSFKCASGGDYYDKHLDAGEAKWYWIGHCQNYIIEETTSYDDGSSRTLHYTLKGAYQYKIVWDDNKHVWDVHLCPKGCDI